MRVVELSCPETTAEALASQNARTLPEARREADESLLESVAETESRILSMLAAVVKAAAPIQLLVD